MIMNNSTLFWASLCIVLASHWYALFLAGLGFTLPFLLFSCIEKLQVIAHRILGHSTGVKNDHPVSKAA